MKYDKMLKRELIALVEQRDKTLARERKLVARATDPLKAQIARFTAPEAIDDLLRTVFRLFKAGKAEHLIQAIATFFDIHTKDAAKIVESLHTWQKPIPDTSVQPEERELIRKEHFKLNQRLAKQDAQIERLIIERTRARQKAQEIARLVSVYRRVLGDVLSDPDVMVVPSLAASPREQAELLVETPGCCSSGVFSDELLKDRNKTAFDEVGE